MPYREQSTNPRSRGDRNNLTNITPHVFWDSSNRIMMYVYIYIPCNAAILLSDQNSRCNWYILGVVLFLCTSTEQTICHRVLKKYPSALVFVNFSGCNIVNLKLKFNLQQNGTDIHAPRYQYALSLACPKNIMMCAALFIKIKLAWTAWSCLHLYKTETTFKSSLQFVGLLHVASSSL